MDGSTSVPLHTIPESAIRENQPTIPVTSAQLDDRIERADRTAARIRSTQSALAVFLGGMTLLLFGGYAQKTIFTAPMPTTLLAGNALQYQVDLNHAGRAELMELPGIGPKMADNILKHRAQHGPFQSLESLQAVSGIGPKTVERLQPWICFDGKKAKALSPPRELEESKYEWAQKQPKWDGKPIDVNTATAEQLQVLPRIGAVLSQRIIDDRERNGPFLSVEHLTRIKGIGVKTVEQLRPYCVAK